MRVIFAYILIIALALFYSCSKKESYFNEELSKIKEFIKNKNIDNMKSDESAGIFYKIIGTGTSSISPGKGSYVSVNYAIEYIDGTKAKSEEDKELYLYKTPSAWQTILPKMVEGQEAIIISTSNISYSNGITDSLRNDTDPLYFNIKLLSVK